MTQLMAADGLWLFGKGCLSLRTDTQETRIESVTVTVTVSWLDNHSTNDEEKNRFLIHFSQGLRHSLDRITAILLSLNCDWSRCLVLVRLESSCQSRFSIKIKINPWFKMENQGQEWRESWLLYYLFPCFNTLFSSLILDPWHDSQPLPSACVSYIPDGRETMTEEYQI